MKQSRLLFTFALFVICSLAFSSCTPTANHEAIVDVHVYELLQNRAKSRNDAEFKSVFQAAASLNSKKRGDFIELFFKKADKLFPKKKFASYFKSNVGIKKNASNNDVKDYFVAKRQQIIEKTIARLSIRLDFLGVSYCEIIEGQDQIKIGLNKVPDEAALRQTIQGNVPLEFLEMFKTQELQDVWSRMEGIMNELVNAQFQARASSDPDHSYDNYGTITSGVFDRIEMEEYHVKILVEDRAEMELILMRKDVQSLFPSNLKFMWSLDRVESNSGSAKCWVLYGCKIPYKSSSRISGNDVENAEAEFNDEVNRYCVNITMNEAGEKKWAKMTRENVGRQVALCIRDEVVSAPRVNAEITGGETEISGTFTEDEAKSLASFIRAGNLPVYCFLKSLKKL